MSISYYNGKISNSEQIAVGAFDRSIYFGDGVYDATIGRGGTVYLLDEHIERLLANANAIGIDCPFTKEYLKDTIEELCKRSGEDTYFVYFQLSRSCNVRVHSAATVGKPNLLITVTPCKIPNPNERIDLVTYPDKRYLYCNIKTLNLLPSVLAATYADERGCDEAVFVRDGIVTECAHSNVSIIKDGVLFTHPSCEKILSGITRRQLIDQARKMLIPVKETAFTVGELYAADEVIVTSSSKLARLAGSVDGIRYEARRGSIGENLTKMLHFLFVNYI